MPDRLSPLWLYAAKHFYILLYPFKDTNTTFVALNIK